MPLRHSYFVVLNSATAGTPTQAPLSAEVTTASSIRAAGSRRRSWADRAAISNGLEKVVRLNDLRFTVTNARAGTG